MTQLGIDFDAPPRARRGDPGTSRASADRVGEFAHAHFGVIHAALVTPGTIYELADRTGLDHVQVARRLPEMAAGGLVEPVPGEKRLGPTGRACRVWRLKVSA